MSDIYGQRPDGSPLLNDGRHANEEGNVMAEYKGPRVNVGTPGHIDHGISEQEYAKRVDALLKERDSLREQLAASQLEVQRLREAIDSVLSQQPNMATRVVEVCAELRSALALPSDLSALREYVEGKTLLCEIADRFHIGEKARNASAILANIDNSIRRSKCLSRIEAHHTEIVTDEDGEECEESLLNWGESPDRYIETYKSALREHEARVLEEAAEWFEANAAKTNYITVLIAVSLRDLAQKKREGK